MNHITTLIQNRLGITESGALAVQEIMEDGDMVDFSEATQAEINAAIKEAHAIWQAGGFANYYAQMGL